MSRDLRQYTRQTTTRLVIGFLLLLFILGDGLIYVLYGSSAALMGLLCLVVGLAPVVLIALALWGLDWLTKRLAEK
jgi:TM2 domain-containing membrane protein YozV